jgi:AraC-like DNA-binding protein
MSSVPQAPSKTGLPFWQRRVPCRELSGYVSSIVGYQENGRRLEEAIEMAALVVPLVISFGAPFSIALGRKPAAGDDYASFTSGLFPGHVVINSTGDSACVQVDFTPLGAYRFFGLPMHELSGRMVGLEDLADRDIALLRRQLEDREDWTARLDLAENFVLERLRGRRPLSPAVASAYRELAFCHGNVRIETIAARLDWSRKHLSQRFQEEIGLPPKVIARMLRFNRTLDLAARHGPADWADLAAECGYADQAHLTREFAEFAGTTPNRWQARAA